MTILVTGGNGYIGKALCKELEYNHRVISLDKTHLGTNPLLQKGDILDIDLLKWINRKHDIFRVIHCAANKYIQECEKNPSAAIDDNIIGTRNVLKAFPKAQIVLISTDKAANPATVYGYSKALCERMVLSHHTFSVVLRLVNVINSTGSVFDKWNKSPDIITVYRPNGKLPKRYFMTLDESVDFIVNTELIDKNIFIPKTNNLSIDKLARNFAKIHNSIIKYIDVKGEKIEEVLFNDLEVDNVIDCGDYYRCDYYRK